MAMRIVSTPNDYAVEVDTLGGNVFTVGVCKYQDGPWKPWAATQFFDGHIEWVRIGDRIDELTADTYEEAVVKVNAHAERINNLWKESV